MEDYAYFILHYKKNSERRNYIFDNFVTGHRPIYWITDFDREEISGNISDFYQFNPDLCAEVTGRQLHVLVGHRLGLNPANRSIPWEQIFSRTQEYVDQAGIREVMQDFPQFMPRPLGVHEISILLKHRAAYAKVVENGYKFGIVLEDDFILKDNSIASLESFIQNSCLVWDFVDIAGGAGLTPRGQDEEVIPGFFMMTPPRSRTACGYLIRNRMCKEIINLNLPLTAPCDWELTYFLLRFNSRAFWTMPPIFIHGSEANFYKSNNN